MFLRQAYFFYNFTFESLYQELIKQGIERSLKIRRDWEMSPFEDKYCNKLIR